MTNPCDIYVFKQSLNFHQHVVEAQKRVEEFARLVKKAEIYKCSLPKLKSQQ